MSRKIFISDVNLLTTLFFPKHAYIELLDPLDKITQDELFVPKEQKNTDKVMVLAPLDAKVYKPDQIANYDYILNFGHDITSLPSAYDTFKFSYVSNPDGTMRWVFPNSLKRATYLNFYNTSSIKSKLMALFIHCFHNTLLSNVFVSGSFTIHASKALQFKRELASVDYDNFSIFMGTVGVNRKIVLELNTKHETTHFAKIATNTHAASLIKNERRVLKNLAHYHFECFEIPQLIESPSTLVGIMSNIKPRKQIQTTEITEVHLKALQELYDKTASLLKVEWGYHRKRTAQLLLRFKNSAKLKETEAIYPYLEGIMKSIPYDQLITVTRSHTDFTPWNSYVSKDKLHVFDWELSKKQRPILFDLFHYIFQSGVLIKHQSFKEIEDDIALALSQPICKQIIERYQINVLVHYKLYLLINTSYYLSIYEKQEKLHKQAYWLMNTWKEALEHVMLQEDNDVTHRTSFISQFLQSMKDKKYALLKFHEEKLLEINGSSDLDVLIQQEDIPSINTFVAQQDNIKNIKTYKKSFMTTIELFFKDQSFLSLDLIYSLQRKSYKFIDENVLLDNVVHKEENIRVLSPLHDFEYTFLFYQSNRADFPMKYFYAFSKFPIEKRIEIKNYINEKYNLEEEDLDILMDYAPNIRKQVMRKLASLPMNKGTKRFTRLKQYIRDTLSSVKTRKGFLVTFSGVDGAGKSTIISLVSSKLSEKYRRKVVILRHRPSLLPILSSYTYGKKEAELRSINKNPRSGNNTQFLSSFIRFAYYLTDYLIGQFYVYFRYTLRGKIVLYDRYYFDFINDAKRSNIVLPKWITKAFFRLVFKPKINFFLYADPDVILKRKQELSKETIVELTNNYQSLFSAFGKKYKHSHYVQIENIDGQKTIDKVMGKITELS